MKPSQNRLWSAAIGGGAVAVLVLGAAGWGLWPRPAETTRFSLRDAAPLPDEQVIAAAPLEISLWAESPLVHNPASIDVDARGRVWVAEAVNYRDWANHQSESPSAAHRPQGDRIVILEDTDGDGRADSSTVFAEDPELVAPLGICVLGRRVFVSCSPHILVFTDDDGDDRADRKEVFLTGFGGFDHDHGVHSVTPGPDGNLYLVAGNAGPHRVTDRSGWTLRAGSYYQWATSGATNSGGLRSDDGEIYVGGVALKIRPDGAGMSVIGHNFRNPYEIAVDSFGDVWQTDNDDTAACRMTWLMERANLGFASADGHRSWQRDHRPGQTLARAHWRQDDPGVLPAGEIYGAGAPTGLLRYEGKALGEDLLGAVLACDAGLGCVFAFRPIPDGAGFRFESERLVWSAPASNERGNRPAEGMAETHFRPTDVAVAPNGDLLISDWYDAYVGGHRVTDAAAVGRIFRVRRETRSNADRIAAPEIDLASADGRLAAFRSASPHVRWLGREALKEQGPMLLERLLPLLSDPNPFVRARTVWLIAESGPKGREIVESRLKDGDPQMRVAALRALRAAGTPAKEWIAAACEDASPAVRREAALALSGAAFEDARPFLIALAAQFDGADRVYLEALGAACEEHAELLYPELRARLGGGPPGEWSPAFAGIVWRLHPQAALEDLAEHCRSLELAPAERRRMIDALAFVGGNRTRRALASLAADLRTGELSATDGAPSLAGYADWWAAALSDPPRRSEPLARAPAAPRLTAAPAPTTPTAAPIELSRIEAVARLKGDAERGKLLFESSRTACFRCHRFDAGGGEIGPDLTDIGRRLSRPRLIEAILFPDASILAGYEAWTAMDVRGRTYTGLLISTGETIALRTADGALAEIPRRQVHELRRQRASLMPQLAQDALSDQDAADLAAFLQQGP
jgi:putative membrane-bound dehydrogenase-like protein